MEAQWYKDAVIYQVHIKSFYDSDADGVGDIVGLTQKLDYLVDLGISALWLMPFYPSPLRDDGYDTANYVDVDPRYGTLQQFQDLLAEAHRRGLRVITELVLNHTSDQHPWFQRARTAAPNSPERDYYVWTDDPEKYKEARIIFKDFEPSNWTWDPKAKAYYWHRFYSHQPDLNYDNPKVHEEALKILDHWMGMGVDGVRLDAVPYLYERDGTNCENLPETHAFLKKLRRYMDENYPGRMLLAEANMWPEEALAYFGEGDECQMEFHFPLMPRMFMAVQMEDRHPIVDIMEQTPSLPEGCQWAIFLRNHDELTLEMVTDEERDYMYRVYAQDPRARINLGIRRRLAPLLDNNRAKIELLNSLLFSMPGTPIIYYGDEIGMGDNIYLGDRDGVRTPMQWSAARNAGFSLANPQKLYLPLITDPEHHYETINVENQQSNLSSLFWWMKRMLSIRAQCPAFGRGEMEFLHPHNAKVLAYLRTLEDERILVVANLSRYAQAVELPLGRYAGYIPVEMFGRTRFPTIEGERPFVLTLGPHAFYWLRLQSPVSQDGAEGYAVPVLSFPAEWSPRLVSYLEQKVLPPYLQGCRWFGGKRRLLESIKLARELNGDFAGARYFLMEAHYTEGDPEQYLVPLMIQPSSAEHPPEGAARTLLARFDGGEVLVDAHAEPAFRQKLVACLVGTPKGGPELAMYGVGADATVDPSVATRLITVEQSNTSIGVGEKFWLKLYRKYEAGMHPEVELMDYLGRCGRFDELPAYAGSLRIKDRKTEGITGVLMEHLRHQGDGWTYTLDALGQYFDRVLERRADLATPGILPELMDEVYPRRVDQLGGLVARLHLALASPGAEADEAAFAPEPFSTHYQRSLYQGMRSSAGRVIKSLERGDNAIGAHVAEDVERLCCHRNAVYAVYAKLLHETVTGQKIRIHGDLHLAQVLNIGDSFVFIDFEGEPTTSLSERRLKRPALRDVASMLRSFDYAAAVALMQEAPEDQELLAPWAQAWSSAVGQRFLQVYLSACEGAAFLPKESHGTRLLLNALLLDKAVYELGYELSYRPAWIGVPLRAVMRLLENGAPVATETA